LVAAGRKRSPEPFSVEGRRAIAIVIGGLVAIKIIVLFILAWNRRIVMDEFVQFGWAKYLSNGLFETIWPTKAVGYAVFFDLAHLVGWDARSMLLTGRTEAALLACGTLAIVYALARAIGQSRTGSSLAVLVLLCFSNFIERIFETRAEPLATFFGAAALLAALRSRDRRWWILAAGVLSGLAMLSTQKAIYFNVALGLALVGDAALDRRYAPGVARGAWLVLGWLIPVVVYCLAFGGAHPLRVAQTVFLGPFVALSPQIAADYGGLRQFVVQTLVRNALLYLFCVAGMILALVRVRRLDGAARIALLFSVIVTALVFVHDQPWPYVFVMALPFMALWAHEPFDALAGRRLYRTAAWAMLALAVAGSFARNVQALRIDNHAQLALVDRAERLVGPNDTYFDGVAMLPNRREPSTWWLDRHAILETRREGKTSVPYRIFADSPPKIILWSYRMDAIEPVVAPLIRNSYAQVAPNIRLAGRLLAAGERVAFDVPIAGNYGLYDLTGAPLRGRVEVDGRPHDTPVRLVTGRKTVRLLSGPRDALLLPVGAYDGLFAPGGDDPQLFANVYD
jgi:hypothetical protein